MILQKWLTYSEVCLWLQSFSANAICEVSQVSQDFFSLEHTGTFPNNTENVLCFPKRQWAFVFMEQIPIQNSPTTDAGPIPQRYHPFSCHNPVFLSTENGTFSTEK